MKYKRTLQIGLALVLLFKALIVGVSWESRLFGEQSAVAEEKGEAAGGEEGSAKVTSGEACEAAGNLPRVLEAVSKKERELTRRQRLVEEREARISSIEEDVTAKIASLEQLERKVAATIETAEQESKAAGESLAKIYSTMKPQEAARILSKLDEGTAMTIFSGMKERNISQILPLVDRQLAVSLTNRLANKASRLSAAVQEQ